MNQEVKYQALNDIVIISEEEKQNSSPILIAKDKLLLKGYIKSFGKEVKEEISNIKSDKKVVVLRNQALELEQGIYAIKAEFIIAIE